MPKIYMTLWRELACEEPSVESNVYIFTVATVHFFSFVSIRSIYRSLKLKLKKLTVYITYSMSADAYQQNLLIMKDELNQDAFLIEEMIMNAFVTSAEQTRIFIAGKSVRYEIKMHMISFHFNKLR